MRYNVGDMYLIYGMLPLHSLSMQETEFFYASIEIIFSISVVLVIFQRFSTDTICVSRLKKKSQIIGPAGSPFQDPY